MEYELAIQVSLVSNQNEQPQATTDTEYELAMQASLVSNQIEQQKRTTTGREREVIGDGNCLFRSFAMAIGEDIGIDYRQMREIAIMFVREHKDFIEFGQITHDWGDLSNYNNCESWVNYMKEDKVWGDLLVVRALCGFFQKRVTILLPTVVDESMRTIVAGDHYHMNGSIQLVLRGNHYTVIM